MAEMSIVDLPCTSTTSDRRALSPVGSPPDGKARTCLRLKSKTGTFGSVPHLDRPGFLGMVENFLAQGWGWMGIAATLRAFILSCFRQKSHLESEIGPFQWGSTTNPQNFMRTKQLFLAWKQLLSNRISWATSVPAGTPPPSWIQHRAPRHRAPGEAFSDIR